MNITNSVKKTKAGIAYTVFQDGVEIGSRCTKKASGFKFVAVARKNHARALVQACEGLAYQREQLAEHEACILDPQSGVRRGFKQMPAWVADGTVARWIVEDKAQIERYTARIAALEGMTQESPEFTAFFVVEFSNTGKTTGKDWHYQYTLIPLTQPETVADKCVDLILADEKLTALIKKLKK